MKKHFLFLAAIGSVLSLQAQSTWTGSSTLTTTNGYVGIGTTSPTTYLHVQPNFSGSQVIPATQAPLASFAYYDQYNNLNPLLQLSYDGRLGVGTTVPMDKLHLEGGGLWVNNGELAVYANSTVKNFRVDVSGNVWARHFTVLAGAIPDYVFAKDYRLMNLVQLEQYINQNQHLPNIPSACDYETAGGVDMGELQLRLLEKVEELTLHIIALNKQVQAQQELIDQLKQNK